MVKWVKWDGLKDQKDLKDLKDQSGDTAAATAAPGKIAQAIHPSKTAVRPQGLHRRGLFWHWHVDMHPESAAGGLVFAA